MWKTGYDREIHKFRVKGLNNVTYPGLQGKKLKMWLKSIIGNKLLAYIRYRGFFILFHGPFSDRLYKEFGPN